MFKYSKNDLLRASCIGQQTTVTAADHSEVTGVLRQIDISGLTVAEYKTGLEIKIRFDDIETAAFGNASARRQMDHLELARFQKQCERTAEQANLTLSRMFKTELAALAQSCGDWDIKEYLEAEIGNTASLYSAEECENLYDFHFKDERFCSRPEFAAAVAEAMVLYRMRRFDKAAALILGSSGTAKPTDTALAMACLASQMRNRTGALYWLERYYLKGLETKISLDNVWWLYLRLCGRYSAYEGACRMLEAVTQDNPGLAVRSLAYLLLINNNSGFAMQLLDYADDVLNANEALELVERNSVYLISDRDNNYRRYVKCAGKIIREGELRIYGDEEDICGYVYDYVPDREFGFIVGCDLISYFFRRESVMSDNVNERIKSNICSFRSVEEEEPVMVTFKRTPESKRSYNAVNIV